MTVVLVHVKCRKKIEGRKRKLSPVHHQTCIVPSRNHEPSSELLRFVREGVQTFVKHANFFTTSSWWHEITSTKVSCVSVFLEIKCHVTPCIRTCVHVVRQICLKIPSNLLHMELTHTQVHKYFFQTIMVSRCM